MVAIARVFMVVIRLLPSLYSSKHSAVFALAESGVSPYRCTIGHGQLAAFEPSEISNRPEQKGAREGAYGYQVVCGDSGLFDHRAGATRSIRRSGGTYRTEREDCVGPRDTAAARLRLCRARQRRRRGCSHQGAQRADAQRAQRLRREGARASARCASASASSGSSRRRPWRLSWPRGSGGGPGGGGFRPGGPGGGGFGRPRFAPPMASMETNKEDQRRRQSRLKSSATIASAPAKVVPKRKTASAESGAGTAATTSLFSPGTTLPAG